MATAFVANQRSSLCNSICEWIHHYSHSSLWSEPVEILLDCASRTECTHILKAHGEYSIATGAVTPVGKARENTTKKIGEFT